MSAYVVCAFLIGVVGGLRSMTAPAAVSWAASLGWMHLENSPLAFMGYTATPYILTVLAIGELIADQLPQTPSRKSPVGFVARIAAGVICGGAFGVVGQSLAVGAVAGVVGAIVGTLGGYEARVRLARAVGKDLPVALAEDVIAIGAACLLVSRL